MLTRTFDTMGTTVSLRLVEVEGVDVDIAVAQAKEAFDELDARFSLYREDSEISQIGRGDLSLAAASDEMRAAYGEALEWRDETGGAFTRIGPTEYSTFLAPSRRLESNAQRMPSPRAGSPTSRSIAVVTFFSQEYLTTPTHGPSGLLTPLIALAR